jgi:hypothetical protein
VWALGPVVGKPLARRRVPQAPLPGLRQTTEPPAPPSTLSRPRPFSDESQQAWLIRAAIAKTRRPRWAALPADLFEALLERLPAREDRDPSAPLFAGITADRLRMAIGRACRDAGVPHFSPHDLRHRRISVLHRLGVSWAEIGERVTQRSKLVTADRYTHALVDGRGVDRAKLLERGTWGAYLGAYPCRLEAATSRDVRAQYRPPLESPP